MATNLRNAHELTEVDPGKLAENAWPIRASRRRSLAVIDRRALELDCFVRCLSQVSDDATAVGFDSLESWLAYRDSHGAHDVILVNLGARPIAAASTQEDLRALVAAVRPVPVIVLSEAEDLEAMLQVLDCGAAGFIPPRVLIEDIVEATRVTASGGVFLPRDSLLSLRQAIAARPAPKTGIEAKFTDRQLAVARALQRGSANKTIAYELNLCESTVKVHIRNIMRILKATNRTQAAFRLNEMTDVSQPQHRM
jgi:DNA-binding NarL/FixJ family response regulator